MNLQQQPQAKPQPMRLSMNTPLDKVYSLAQRLHSSQEAQEAFYNQPSELLNQFGMGLNNPTLWAGHKDKGHPGKEKPGKPKEDGSETEAIGICAVVTNVGVAGVVVCGVALAVPPEEPMAPIEEV